MIMIGETEGSCCDLDMKKWCILAATEDMGIILG
jgi:hypothetical protein